MSIRCSSCRYGTTHSLSYPCNQCKNIDRGVSDMFEDKEAPEAEIDVTVEDLVNSPAHYNRFPVEVIQLCRHLNFNRGNVVKYCARAGYKNTAAEVEDLRKAIWYLEDEIQRITGEGTHAKP